MHEAERVRRQGLKAVLQPRAVVPGSVIRRPKRLSAKELRLTEDIVQAPFINGGAKTP